MIFQLRELLDNIFKSENSESIELMVATNDFENDYYRLIDKSSISTISLLPAILITTLLFGFNSTTCTL